MGVDIDSMNEVNDIIDSNCGVICVSWLYPATTPFIDGDAS